VANLFLIDGASGTGKSDLVEYAKSSHGSCGVVVKATTRELRDFEQRENVALDLTFHSIETFNALGLEYIYEYGGRLYGFSKRQLDECLKDFCNVFVIIRNIPLMNKIKQDYKKHKVIAVYVHSDLRLIDERLISQGRTQSQIDFRLSRISNTLADYVQHSSSFDEVVINSSDKNTYHTLIGNLIKKYSLKHQI